MASQINLYNFSKKTNSTALPSASDIVVSGLTINLKEDTSVLNPTFLVTSNSISGLNYNYIYWNMADRYYFINDVVKRNNNITELVCSCDYLASWRSTILASSQFVARSASSYDSNIIDCKVVATENIVQTLSGTGTNPFPSDEGCFIIRAVGGTGNQVFYVVDRSELLDVLDFMYNSNSFPDFIQDGIIKFFFDPLQYLMGVMWFPMSKSAVPKITGHTNDEIWLGYWNTSARGGAVDYKGTSWSNSITIPSTSYYGDFRDRSDSFTEVVLWLPGYGTYKLSAEYVGQTVGVTYYVDLITGQGTIALSVSGATIADVAIQIGCDIQLTQSQADIKGQISNAMSMFSGASQGNVAQVTNSATQAASSAFAPLLTQKGSLTNRSMYNLAGNLRAYVIRKGSSNPPTVREGRPLMNHVLLSTLSGYCVCDYPSITMTGLDTERQAIESIMSSGFYIE